MGQTESMGGKNREKMIRRKKKTNTLTLECRGKNGEMEEIGSKV